MRRDVKEGIFLNTEYESYMVGDNISFKVSGQCVPVSHKNVLKPIFKIFLKSHGNL